MKLIKISLSFVHKKYIFILHINFVILDKSACDGDCGGPVTKFMAVNGKALAHVVGLVSYGRVFCGRPAVYTDVVYFVPWTLDTLKNII